jgi:hypothetical protein
MMSEKCECGDIANMFMNGDGDPLPKPLCFSCWSYYECINEPDENEALAAEGEGESA